ncbi:RES domain protein (plasmid) [Labrenzia sp. THAF191b]|uniref:RES domain-containing protein n=1 Tax=Roseibium alexandrii (strain DSM 17067 / NCIMB 14079 / DFL-11) TaxID=244592 RepID=A0A5E8H7Y7_ROSAD|nr:MULTISPECIES: RES family NAD+ phosphorylase [Stappiaceae]EEE48208.1 hypothetical protein SADFL11_102 [Roseibium alexandrii DFL-11]QFT02000.1 RES domain protein [Labrenzia sp. THAF191b]QFT08375.1 RES domain protein [Labrenzia sp. THAF191a]QFT19843.1 RES domain protein [Labrenzia sp. THAF187b]QFT71189.1 RES domain protein [Labrenzia sp. THAF35]
MVSYSGKLYRALNPVYAREPMSGRGAALYGGRFNPKGVPALYTSTSVLTALREANQVGDLQPTTLVCYRAEIEMVFDTTDRAALEAVGLNEVALADPAWRDQMKTRGQARTQRFASDLVTAGYNGLLVRSFAKGAGPGDMNLVLWKWGTSASCCLELIDDEDRLR